MHPPVLTNDPAAVEVDVQAAYLAIVPRGNRSFVSEAFRRAIDCFEGRYKNYQAVDTRYHDLEHTLQGTLCLGRLLRGRHEAGATPALTEHLLQLGILAILLHDTGYLKTREDREGTGGKYTVTHVDRSADFAAGLLAELGFSPTDIQMVRNMIQCTGVNAGVRVIPFHSELERIIGHALATADLLGQMAAADYVEKLPLLYAEFAEAARFSNDPSHFVARFSSAAELMQHTPEFWENQVLPELDRVFEGLYRFLNHPYPDGPNSYLDGVNANMARLRKMLATAEA